MYYMDNLPDTRAEGFKGQILHRIPKAVLDRIRKRPYIRDFVVTDLGYFHKASGHSVTRTDAKKQTILIFVESGRGWVKIGENTTQISARQMLIIPGGQAHAYGASDEAPWSIFWFHFEGQVAQDLLNWTLSKHSETVVSPSSPDSIQRHFRAALKTIERGYHEHALLELSRQLINVLTRLYSNPQNGQGNPSIGRIEEIMDQMMDDIASPRTLSEYARLAGLSIAQFSHLFKEHTGVSPMSYLTELRMQRASELLDQKGTSIKAIAHEVGFQDPLYFSRCFRKCTGISPQAYRHRLE